MDFSTLSVVIVQAMEAGDPTARWIMQAWLFFNEGFFWKPPQIQVGTQRMKCLML
jgi:Alpha-N-acetylglucosaminidase (NAGLU) tim-barrel domain